MKSFRPERVGHVIREVVSEAISSRLNDPRIEPLSSVTRVEVTPDLEYAKVWISVIGNEAAGRRTVAGLKSAAGFVQGMLAKELQIRITPRLSFHLDESIKKGEQTLRLIEKVMSESPLAPPAEPEEAGEDPDAAESEEVEGESD